MIVCQTDEAPGAASSDQCHRGPERTARSAKHQHIPQEALRTQHPTQTAHIPDRRQPRPLSKGEGEVQSPAAIEWLTKVQLSPIKALKRNHVQSCSSDLQIEHCLCFAIKMSCNCLFCILIVI